MYIGFSSPADERRRTHRENKHDFYANFSTAMKRLCISVSRRRKIALEPTVRQNKMETDQYVCRFLLSLNLIVVVSKEREYI